MSGDPTPLLHEGAGCAPDAATAVLLANGYEHEAEAEMRRALASSRTRSQLQLSGEESALHCEAGDTSTPPEPRPRPRPMPMLPPNRSLSTSAPGGSQTAGAECAATAASTVPGSEEAEAETEAAVAVGSIEAAQTGDVGTGAPPFTQRTSSLLARPTTGQWVELDEA